MTIISEKQQRGITVIAGLLKRLSEDIFLHWFRHTFPFLRCKKWFGGTYIADERSDNVYVGLVGWLLSPPIRTNHSRSDRSSGADTRHFLIFHKKYFELWPVAATAPVFQLKFHGVIIVVPI